MNILLDEEDNVYDQDVIYSHANLNKRGSELPVNLWLDENKYYLRGKHAKRIKFQMDYGNKINDRNMASMTLDGNVVWNTYDEQSSEINMKDIRQVSNFVKNNAYALNCLSDNIIGTYDFFQVMIKGGELATKEQIEEQKRLIDEIMYK